MAATTAVMVASAARKERYVNSLFTIAVVAMLFT